MVKVLFVCLGNICRSPAAEGVFRFLVEKEGLNHKIKVDSAGTSAYHIGEMADFRMRECASRRGYELTSLARRFTSKDFDDYDFIVVMDGHNHRDVLAMARDETDRRKVSRMTYYLEGMVASYVPDPYYKGEEGFGQVLDMIENASLGLLRNVKSKMDGDSVV